MPARLAEAAGPAGRTAVQAARAVGYVGAGTVEFLLVDDGSFYFLEMNTRIQVEHPVTECVTGIDLVRLQFTVAQGRPLPFAHSDVALRGHAIEARLYAEDASADFLPSTGRIVAWRGPQGEGIRVDCGLESGATVSPHYDSLLAKVIAFGADREEARLRLVRALEDTFVAGVATNRDFLIATLSRPEFVDGEATTAFLAAAPPQAASRPRREAIALAALLFVERGGAPAPTAAWRASPVRLAIDGSEVNASVRRQAGGWRGSQWLMSVDSETVAIELVSRTEQEVRFCLGGVLTLALYARHGEELWLDFDGACRLFVDRTYAPPRREEEISDGAARSPVSGVIVAVEAKAGDGVRRGQVLATVEAMKMQYAILAPIDGVVATANAAAPAPRLRRGLSSSPSNRTETSEMDKAVVTCALTGVLTDPAVYPAPVTPDEMAREAKRAADEGASVVHIHFRRLEPGKGHLPSWDPEVATAVVGAVRDACPGHHRQCRRPASSAPTFPARWRACAP